MLGCESKNVYNRVMNMLIDSNLKYLTLSDLTLIIKESILNSFPDNYWVVAEISDLKVNQRGHCYLELVEKQNDTIVAQMRANIWAYDYRRLSLKFLQETGEFIKGGMKILFLVAVSFHEVYGLSLNIKDLDPTYTMGELSRKKKEILNRLQKEGLIDLNKGLSLPLVPQRIAVISSPTAAGYGDFINHLENNIYGYKFNIKLLPSIMQGDEAEKSILNSIREIRKQKNLYDIVVIVRGGGSQLDLSCFDNYEISAEIAKLPLPVITGIGHDRDDTIADLVAHTKLKTPTAVAEFIISGLRSFEDRIIDLRNRIIKNTEHILKDKNFRLQNTLHNLMKASLQTIERNGSKIEIITHKIQSGHGAYIERKYNNLSSLQKNLQFAINQIFLIQKNKLNNLQKAIHLLEPTNTLKRGYSITYLNGKSLKDINNIENGATISTRLYRGNIFSKVIELRSVSNETDKDDNIQ